MDGAFKEAKQLCVVFAGGGTGGHLYPAIALAAEVKRRDPLADVYFIGTTRGLESRVLPELGWPLRTISVRGLRRRLAVENLALPFRVLISLVQVLLILRQTKPQVVVGTGGYVSGPALVGAKLLGVPRLIQEQNVRPGATTRILAKIADEVHLSFPESAAYFRSKQNLRSSGNPVRAKVTQVSTTQAREKLGLRSSGKVLLVFGGSQGAHSINLAMMSALDQLMQRETLQLVWGTGKADFKKAHAVSERFGDRVRVMPYIDDMPTVYRASDLAVCRAGAITISELESYGLPAILVPYPFAAAQHQEWNARTLVKHDVARMILDGELSPDRLLDEVGALLDDDNLRAYMGARMAELAQPEATNKIVDSILTLAARYHAQTGNAAL